MGRNKENRTKARKQSYIFTKGELKLKLKFHELIMETVLTFNNDKYYNVKDNWKKIEI